MILHDITRPENVASRAAVLIGAVNELLIQHGCTEWSKDMVESRDILTELITAVTGEVQSSSLPDIFCEQFTQAGGFLFGKTQFEVALVDADNDEIVFFQFFQGDAFIQRQNSSPVLENIWCTSS